MTHNVEPKAPTYPTPNPSVTTDTITTALAALTEAGKHAVGVEEKMRIAIAAEELSLLVTESFDVDGKKVGVDREYLDRVQYPEDM